MSLLNLLGRFFNPLIRTYFFLLLFNFTALHAQNLITCNGILSGSSDAADLKELPKKVQDLVRTKDPFGNPLAVKIVDGQLVAFGAQKAMEHVKSTIERHRSIVLELGDGLDVFKTTIDGQLVIINPVPALSGSAVRTEKFGDLDIETTLIVQYPGFREQDLHDPKSLAGRALALYFQEYIRKVRVQNPKYTLTDFKAGEYDRVPDNEAARKTKSRAIKWSLEELEAGFKIIQKNGQSVTLNLADALTSESRIKLDWSSPGLAHQFITEATGITYQDIDANITYNIAGREGNGTPILSVAHKNHFPETGATGGHLRLAGMGGFSPMRLTTVFFTAEHASLAQQASVSTPRLNLLATNAHLLNVTRTYRDRGEYLKVLKRLAIRLNYWDDLPVFCAREGLTLTPRQFQRDVAEITETDEINILHQLKIIAEGHRIKKELQGNNEIEIEKFITLLKEYLIRTRSINIPTAHDDFFKIETAATALSELIERKVYEGLQRKPHIMNYVSFVLDAKRAYAPEKLREKAVFFTFKPDSSFVQGVIDRLSNWQHRFSRIPFSRINDLHMTAVYVGRVTDELFEKVVKIFEKYREKFRAHPFTLNNGTLNIIGSNNNQLGVVFPSDGVPQPVLDLLHSFKTELVEIGLRPDKHFEDVYLPHVSLAHLRDAYFSEGGHQDIHKMLGSHLLPPELRRVEISGELYLMEVEEAALNNSQDRYRAIEFADAVNSVD